MEMFVMIAGAALFCFLIFRMYPTAKHWMENGPKAEQGDWQAAIIPLAAVVGFVILLIMMVRM